MTTVGGILERKEIGLSIGVSGTHNNTEIDSVTGHLRLAQVDTDGSGNPIFAEEGTWISDVINLEDKFADFEKVFSSSLDKGSSSIAILTRVSDNNMDWSNWVAVGYDGAILSDTKQYIQIRIDLFAGFVTDLFLVANSDFEKNEFVEEKEIRAGGYITPTLTSNTSSPLGLAFSSSNAGGAYLAWKAFDNVGTSYMRTAVGQQIGFVGFMFNEPISITKYSIGNAQGLANIMATSWILQASEDTTDGIDGKWLDLDIQTNQSWTTTETIREISVNNTNRFKAFRVLLSNPIVASDTTVGIGSVNFFTPAQTTLQLKRNYKFNMVQDSTWSETGSLHRKSITRDEWLRINRLEVI